MLFTPKSSARLIALSTAFAFILFLYWHFPNRAERPVFRKHSPAAPVPPRKNTIVMAATKNDVTSWVSEELPEYEPMIYSVDNHTAPLHTPINKGKESMAYLTYVIDNYHRLPNISIFLHAHKEGFPAAWHTDVEGYSNVASVRLLRQDTVRARGYVNLRCNWVPGCPDEIQPFRTTDAHRTSEHQFVAAWKALFGPEVEVPRTIGSTCCAQFAVTREAIQKRTLQEYQRYRQWLIETKLDDELSGRIFEYLWHIIFGREAVVCPIYEVCQCDVYGLGCNEGTSR